MKSPSRMMIGLCSLLMLAATLTEPVLAQVDGVGSCDREFDADPNTARPSLGTCTGDGVIFLDTGELQFFKVTGRAEAFPNGDDTYDVQLNVRATGDFPDGLAIFGQAEVRSTNGFTCLLPLSTGADSLICPDMFSSDGVFRIFVDAFSGNLPN